MLAWLGLFLGVIALGTGIGALAVGATLAGLLLAGISVAAGASAAVIDYGPCHAGDPVACVGFWLGLGGTGLGIFSGVGAGLLMAGAIPEYGAVDGITMGAGGLSYTFGGIGAAWDAGNGLGGNPLCPNGG